VFYEQFYYDGQCEPQYRNINFRDPVRAQPPATDFSSVPINDPADVTAPLAVAIEPVNGVTVPEGVTRLYFTVDDTGVSEPCSATVFVDGQAVTNTSASPVALSLPRGQHMWQVQGFDSVGNSSFSALNLFIVGSAVPDTTPPSVAITAPANGALLSGTNVVVSATATDNVAVASVQFRLDGLNLGAARTTAPYSINWDTTTSTNGPHQLTAVARDLASNQSTSAVVNVTVQGLSASLATIERNATNVIISWPTVFAGYQVYWSRTMTGASWQPVTNPVVVIGGRNQVSVLASERAAFFRLQKQ
jgi:hypothetical protein